MTLLWQPPPFRPSPRGGRRRWSVGSGLARSTDESLIGTITVTTNPVGQILAGQTVTLTAVRTGGAAPLTYAWSGPAGTTAPVGTTTSRTLTWTAAGTDSGTYTVTVTSAAATDGPTKQGGAAIVVVVGPTAGWIYLPDLTPFYAENFWGPYERDMSNGENAAGDGSPLTINGVVYARGLGVHAWSDLRYQLDGGYTRFQAYIGLDDEVVDKVNHQPRGNVQFRLYTGPDINNLETVIYQSPEMNTESATVFVDVDVTGVTYLRFYVDAQGDTAYDHADWGDARLLPASTVTMLSGVSIALPASAPVDISPYDHLAVRFTPEQDVVMTGLRFYRPVTNTNSAAFDALTTVALLSVPWTSQTLKSFPIAAVPVAVAANTTGWVTATFPEPILLKAGTAYEGGYRVPANWGYGYLGNPYPIDGGAASPLIGNGGNYAILPSPPSNGENSTGYFFADPIVTTALSTRTGYWTSGESYRGANDGNRNTTDGVSYDLGQRFTLPSAGTITKLRYWRAVGETPQAGYTIRLYNAAGTLLASEPIPTNSTRGCYVTIPLTTPVSVAAGTYNVMHQINSHFLNAQGVGANITTLDGVTDVNGLVNMTAGAGMTGVTVSGSNGRYGAAAFFVPNAALSFRVALEGGGARSTGVVLQETGDAILLE